MHDALSKPAWDVVEAVVRLCLATQGADWADGEVSDADVREPAGQQASRTWIDRIGSSWGPAEGIPLVSPLPPLVWVRWAMDQCEAPLRRQLEVTVAQWNFASVCAGKFPVMRKRGKGPNLIRYGLVGHGLPIHEFLRLEQFDPKDAWTMAFKERLATPAVATQSQVGAAIVSGPGSGSAALKRSRGRGVEQAVSTALDLFFAKDDRLQHVLPPPVVGPRYRMENMTRKEMVKALKRRFAGLRRYKEPTIVAELSRRVIFPRGRPSHR